MIFDQRLTINMRKIMETEFSKAVKVVTAGLREDKELWETYQANIAMAFYDAYNQIVVQGWIMKNPDIHKIANTAATNFLKQWTD